MDIILLENVRNLGTLGQQVSVKAGYGRNFLIPSGKAVPATVANIKVFNERRAEFEQKNAEKLTAALARGEQLSQLTVAVAAKSGDEGKLFGSVGTRDIADAITAAGVVVDKNEVRLPDGALRYLGEYEIDVQLHPEVTIVAKITVVAQ